MLSLELRSVSKEFHGTLVINGVDLVVEPGTSVAILGRSGSGKSTILHIMSLIEKASSGEVIFDGINCSDLSEAELSEIRRKNIGFLHQYHHLLSDFSVKENIELAQYISKKNSVDVMKLMELLGINNQRNQFPNSLSGGQAQRAAFARAIASDPKIIFADEPTGSLDRDNAALIFSMIIDGVKRNKYSAVIATHDESMIGMVDKCYRMVGGKIIPF